MTFSLKSKFQTVSFLALFMALTASTSHVQGTDDLKCVMGNNYFITYKSSEAIKAGINDITKMTKENGIENIYYTYSYDNENHQGNTNLSLQHEPEKVIHGKVNINKIFNGSFSHGPNTIKLKVCLTGEIENVETKTRNLTQLIAPKHTKSKAEFMDFSSSETNLTSTSSSTTHSSLNEDQVTDTIYAEDTFLYNRNEYNPETTNATASSSSSSKPKLSLEDKIDREAERLGKDVGTILKTVIKSPPVDNTPVPGTSLTHDQRVIRETARIKNQVKKLFGRKKRR
jgi:hypothetical protein